ncbi:MAG TPA: pyruvate kinase [Lacunisphaera sp.]|jgi:pyruvate kinase
MPKLAVRRTKIIATLGPATESGEMLGKLISAGVDIVRLNMAHAKHDWTRTVIRRIRTAAEQAGREVAIMMDIKGPEIRTGDLAVPIELKPGEIFDFTVKPGTDRQGEEIRSVDVNYQDLVNDIKVGDTVLVDSGLIRLEVLSKDQAHIRCRVLTPGSLTSRRHINLPGVKVNLPAFTEKDKGDTLVGIEEGIDYVALSFVREAADINQLRAFLKEHKAPDVRIVAKIEDQSAIDNLDEIIQATDALMVARGDLGIEVPLEELPVIQRRAVRTCLAIGRPVIIATHMLESMITQPMPTRAEITDVANAVFEQADCVMLSGETTIGKYPLECIHILDTISRRIEEEFANDFPPPAVFNTERMKVLRSAVVMANQIPKSSIVVFTRHGTNAAGIAAHRPAHSPILAITDSVATMRQLRMVRSVEPFLLTPFTTPEGTLDRGISMLIKHGRIEEGDKLIIVSDVQSGQRRIVSIQLRTVE